MINITIKGNRVKIEGHTDPIVCASVSTILYTCYNILTEYDPRAVEFKDSLELNENVDNVEIIIRRRDKNTEPVWNVMCLEFGKLAEDYPNSVTLNKDIN